MNSGSSLLLIFLLCGLGATLDDENPFSSEGEDHQSPKPCCLPDTWHGFVKIIFGLAEGRQRARGGKVMTEMFVDGQRKRAAGKVNTGYPKADFTFVGLFNESTGKGFRFYSYKTSNATKCWTYYWDKFEYYKPCLPREAEFKGSFHVGLKNSGLIYNAWEINETRSDFSFIAEILVTQDGCVPVVLRDLGRSGAMPKPEDDDYYDGGFIFTTKSPRKSRPKPPMKKFVVSALYSDLELQIADDEVFELPPACISHPKRYPPNQEDLTDPETKEGFEYLEAVMGHAI